MARVQRRDGRSRAHGRGRAGGGEAKTAETPEEAVRAGRADGERLGGVRIVDARQPAAALYGPKVHQEQCARLDHLLEVHALAQRLQGTRHHQHDRAGQLFCEKRA